MRGASWVFIVCVTLSAVSLFLPSFELQTGGAVGRRGGLSLYQAQRDRAFVRALVGRYQRSSRARVGGALLAVLAPRVGGRLGGNLGDAHDAMDTLDQVSEGDAGTLGTALVVTLWGLLGLHVVIAGLVLGDVVQGTRRRRRAVLAAIGAVLVAALVIALHLGSRYVIAEANDEVGRPLIGLGVGAFLGPLAAIFAVIAGAVVVASSRRTG